ncbi:MAG: thioredoxin [Akkermansia sp.]|nr:thioredoxin [Akkermansia sp.]
MALTFTDANFEEEVLQSPIPVLVDFWAPWCGPCKAISPLVDQIAVEMAGRAKVGKVNVDEDATQNLCARYNIRSIPTLLFIRNGQVVETLVGASSKDNILSHLKACL